MIAARLSRSLHRHPAGLLLAAQLLAVLLYPFMQDSLAGTAAFVVFGNVVLALALWVVNRSPAVNWIAWLLALPAAGLSLAAYSGSGARAHLLPVAQGLEAALYFYAAAGLIFYMLGDSRVTMDELLAAGATFTLLAWAFAFTFSVCQSSFPGSFTAAVDPQGARGWLELLFLSFSLLSGAGLSDVAPVKPLARSLVMLEMFCGVMYIALIVSRLIAMATMRRARVKDKE